MRPKRKCRKCQQMNCSSSRTGLHISPHRYVLKYIYLLARTCEFVIISRPLSAFIQRGGKVRKREGKPGRKGLKGRQTTFMLYPGLVGVLPPLLLLFWGVIICFGLLGSFTPPKRKYPKGVTLGVCICMCFWLLCVFVCLRPVHMCFNFCLLSFHNTTIKKKTVTLAPCSSCCFWVKFYAQPCRGFKQITNYGPA